MAPPAVLVCILAPLSLALTLKGIVVVVRQSDRARRNDRDRHVVRPLSGENKLSTHATIVDEIAGLGCAGDGVPAFQGGPNRYIAAFNPETVIDHSRSRSHSRRANERGAGADRWNDWGKGTATSAKSAPVKSKSCWTITA